jgi:hypothetical protein
MGLGKGRCDDRDEGGITGAQVRSCRLLEPVE